jgi:hypothetical protein
MTGDIPLYATVVFVLTTLVTVGFLFRSFRSVRPAGIASQLLVFLIPFWMILTGFLASSGFYAKFDIFPARIFTFGVLPAVMLIVCYFIFFRRSFIESLSLRSLTMLHIIRVPVEICLLWLFQAALVPRVMTFEGWNFDILSGLTAPLVYWLGFRNKQVHRPLLIVWNLAALGLLANIVVIAMLSIPSPIQKLGFDQPNIAVAYMPFIWLPAIVVPIVVFAHVASLWKLFRGQTA